MINARADTVAEKPAFREAFGRRHCVVPMSGFYEWRKVGAGKTPYYVHLLNAELFGVAGLHEFWPGKDGAAPIESFTIITTDANELMRPLHDRMPAILHEADYEAWLEAAGPHPGRTRVPACALSGGGDAGLPREPARQQREERGPGTHRGGRSTEVSVLTDLSSASRQVRYSCVNAGDAPCASTPAECVTVCCRREQLRHATVQFAQEGREPPRSGMKRRATRPGRSIATAIRQADRTPPPKSTLSERWI